MISEVFYKSYNDFPFNEREILRYAGCRNVRNESDDGIMSMLNECTGEVTSKKACRFLICYRFFTIKSNDGKTVDIGATHYDSTALAVNLKECSAVTLLAATLGHDFDRIIHRYIVTDPVKALYMQAIGAERIETMLDRFVSELPDIYCDYTDHKGVALRPRFSPGFGDLPITIQPEFLNLINAQKKLGITLNGSMLMSPSKSVTAFVGIKDGL